MFIESKRNGRLTLGTRRAVLLIAALTLMATGSLATDASASHFRHGNLNWTKTAGAPAGAQRLTVQNEQSWRWDNFGSPAQGSVIAISEGCIAWGDGSPATCPQYLVEFVNAAENYMRVQALAPGSQTNINVPHDYANPSGIFTISTGSCCTIGGLQNAAGASWNILSTANLAGDDESALSTIPAIVTLPAGGVQQFTVPAGDVGGETLFFRLSTASESCVGCSTPQPPGLSIDSGTGVVTFDTTGKSGLYWTGVVIESRNLGGAVVATSQIQYIINVGAGGSLNLAPVWDAPTPADGTVFTINPGDTVSFTMQASDPNSDDTVSILKNAGPGTFTPTNGNPATGAYSFTATGADAGLDQIVQFIAQDQNGAGPPFRSYRIKVNNVDTTPPDTTITSGPSGLTAGRNPSFGFGSTEVGSTFQCKLDGPAATTGTFGNCTSPKAYASLADGAYTFSVKAKDPAGNEDPSPATRTFTVDATPPQTTITDGPTDPTPDGSPSFSFTSNEAGSTFQCKLDGPDAVPGSFGPCASPRAYAELSDGAYTFSVRAKDPAGNEDPTPATRTFTVDTTPPDTTITSGPTGVTTNRSPSFGFGSEAGATFECRLDGPGATAGSFSACTSPRAYANLADGAYTFSVKATDFAGNEDPTPATRTFTVDTTPPDTTITSGPTGVTTNRSPSFGFGSEAGATFECGLDGPGATAGSFAPCTSPRAYASLADGAYTFSVRAKDPAGNEDPTPATRTFTVDTTPPDTTITSGPTGPTTDRNPSLGFSSEPGATFECRIDGPTAIGSFGPCTSPRAFSNLVDGAYTFTVKAKDAAGNEDPTPATRTFTVDTTGPETNITSGPNSVTTDRNPSFGFSSEPGATFQCRVDGGGLTPCTSPLAVGPLNEGRHTFDVRAVDALGNVDPTPASETFTIVAPPPRPVVTPFPAQIDTAPPDTALTAGPTGSTTDRTPTFVFSSSEPGSTFQCSLDGGPWVACTSPLTFPVSAGPHTFRVRAIDRAGNVDPSPASTADLGGGDATFTLVVRLPAPTLGKLVNAVPEGTVLVSVPAQGARASASVPGLKGRTFVPLREPAQLPVRSIVDARRGTLKLTTARISRGATQSGEFGGGVFQVLQSGKRRLQGLTELPLKGASFSVCTASRNSSTLASPLAQASQRRRTIRKLRGRGTGRFRTRGRYSAATVRGTDWTVTDRCDGTLTTVRRGTVAVRDFRLRKTVLIRAGRSYFARGPLG